MFEFWALNALWALNLQCQKFRASSSVAIFLDHHGFPGIYIYLHTYHCVCFQLSSLCPCSHSNKIIASQDVVVLQKSSEVGNTSRIDVASCGLNVILLMAELLHQLIW